jgi:hypothetical protein
MANLSSTNVTDKTRREFFAKALKTKQAHEEAMSEARSLLGAHRAILKEAKKAGISVSAITRVLAERSEDPDIIQIEEQEYIRMKAISGQPFSFQDDLLGGPTLDLSEKEKEAISVDRAYDDGVFCGAAGHTRTTNKHFAGTEQHDAWDRGWIAGQKQNVDSLAPKKKTPRTPRKGKQTGEEAQAAE